MTSLPDGHSDSGECRRQVLVVEEDRQRSQELCALLTHHGLPARPVSPNDLALEVQACPGVVLIGSHPGLATGRTLAERIRTFDAHIPIVLLGSIASPSPGRPLAVQACLPQDAAPERLVRELARWLQRAPAPATTRHGEILVVDDEPKFRTILKHYLELRGFVVAEADCGEAARAHLSRATPKAILLDVRMPGMDGLLTLKHVRVTHPDLPVVLITHLDEDAVRDEAVTLGVHDYLTKPFDFEHLEAILLTL